MGYDGWLANQVEKYYEECTPKPVDVHLEFEGRDEMGNLDYSEHIIYNCEECDNSECEYWEKYGGH